MHKHILIYISSLSAGGAERVASNLASSWAYEGRRITVVTLSDASQDFYKLAPEVERISLDLRRNSANPLRAVVNNVSRVLALRRILQKKSPDIALAMMDKANIILSIAALGLSDIVVIGAERTHPPQIALGLFWSWMRWFWYGRLSAITALTKESRDWLLSNTEAKKVVVIPNAVYWPLPAQEPKLEPQAFLTPGRKILLAVGRLSVEKGFDVLLETFSKIAAKHCNWDLVLVGEGPLRSFLEAQSAQSRLQHRIHLVGIVGNVGHWYQVANLFVMSSRFEGFPNTLAEALAHGLPAVSFDCDTGPRDIIRHEVDGLLVPVGDSKSFAEAIDLLMRDDALRDQFSSRAKEARNRFSVERVSGLWEALFDELSDIR